MSARKDRVLAVISRRPLMTSRAKPTTGQVHAHLYHHVCVSACTSNHHHHDHTNHQALYVLVEAGVDVAFIASLLMVVDCQCMFDEP